VYHVELRKFPHVVCRFNQSEAQLRALVVPWVRQEWVEQGERKWNANDATLTVLEGPQLSMPELAMGKGWRNAQKRSQDVTGRVLAAARGAGAGAGGGEAAVSGEGAHSSGGAHAAADAGSRAGAEVEAAPERAPERAGAGDLGLLADSLALELLALLDRGPVAPLRAWTMAHERLALHGGSASAAEALALAERAVRSLLERRLAVLAVVGEEEGEDERLQRSYAMLAAAQTWAGDRSGRVLLARKS
jgi:hypothetical protein